MVYWRVLGWANIFASAPRVPVNNSLHMLAVVVVEVGWGVVEVGWGVLAQLAAAGGFCSLLFGPSMVDLPGGRWEVCMCGQRVGHTGPFHP